MPEAVVAAPRIEGVTAAFNREAVERVSASEPEWLRELRLEAWDVYERTPLPTRKLEEWRYTDVRLLKLNDVRLAAADGGATLASDSNPGSGAAALSERPS